MNLHGKILDADGHIIERDAELFEYLEPPYSGGEGMLGFPFFPTIDGFHRGAIITRLGIHKEYRVTAKVWLDFLDEVGIESTVLYPSQGVTIGLIQDPTWATALCRAYNNWVTDRFQRVSPRLRAVALLPLQDVPEAVKELHRAVTELEMVAALLPGHSGDLGVRKGLGHPDFWPVYEEAERLGVPLSIHGAPSINLGFNYFTQFAQMQSLNLPFAKMMQITSMVLDGVFERFPRLRVAYLEAGTGWVPYMMDRLDRSYEVWTRGEHREFSPWVKKKPSEYIKSGRLYFGCEGGEESLVYTIERIGHRNVLFTSDFPHETNIRRAKHEIAELQERSDLSDEAKQAILRDNAARYYGRQG